MADSKSKGSEIQALEITGGKGHIVDVAWTAVMRFFFNFFAFIGGVVYVEADHDYRMCASIGEPISFVPPGGIQWPNLQAKGRTALRTIIRAAARNMQ
eukprot:352616-Amorphochlora_amoeboformis.AAC.1